MYRKLASALLVASALSAKYADAVSLGELTMKSALNEPLEAEIRLTDAGDLDTSQILIDFADNKAYSEAGLERTFFHSSVKFDVSLDGEGNGVITLRSDKRLNEPFIDLLIQAKWPTGRMLRAYTALVDLPVYTETETATVDTGKRPESVTATQAAAAEKQKAAASSSTAKQKSRTEAPAKDDEASAEQTADTPKREKPRNPASMAPLEENEYRTERNDTLWDISSNLAGDGITINQAMVAVQRFNQDAFIGDNINRLKAGVVLRLPSRQAIREISAQSANQQVAAQNREWKGAQLDTDTSTGQAANGRPAASEEGHLRLTSAGASAAAGQDAEGRAELQQQLNQAQDELAAARRDKQDLGSRVESLSSQVDQLKRMVELKDAELASLQNQLGQKGEQPADSKKVADKAEQKASEQAVKEKPAEAKPKEADVAPAGDKPAKKVATPKPEKEAAKPKPAPEKKQPEPSLVDRILANPIYIGIPAILIIAGVVGFLLRRRTQQERQLLEENDSFAFDDEQDLTPPSLDDDLYAGAESEDQGVADHAGFDETPAAGGDEDQTIMAEAPAEQEEETTTVQTGDAISEAEIYIAYNRYDQAIELLQNAIAGSPNDAALHSKLLEVCIESGDKESFRDAFPQLQALGDENAITHIKDLLSNADAADWLDDLPDASAAPAADEIDQTEAAEESDDFGDELSLDSDLDFDSLGGDEGSESAADDDSMLDLSDELEGGLDLDSSLDDFSGGEQDVSEGEDVGEELSLDDLDLGDETGEESDWSVTDDLSGDDMTSLEDSFVSQEPESETPDSEPAADSPDLESGPGGEEELSLDEEELSLDTDDLSLDLGLDETHLDSDEEAQPQTADDEEVLDFDGLELDSEPEQEVEPTSAGGGDTEEQSDEISLDDLRFDDLASDTDESAQAETDAGEAEVEPAAEEDEDQETLSLSDFDLDFDDIEPESDEQTMVREAVSDEEPESVEETPEPAPAPETPEEEPQAAPAVEETPEAPAEQPSVETEAHESQPLDVLEEDDLTFLSDADEVSTKLDLAQAYIDMGDIDGARGILLEVVKEGSEEQKTDASAMLDTLE